MFRKAIPKHNLHAFREKSNAFSAFFSKILTSGGRTRLRPRVAGGGCAASVDSFARVRHLVLPRNANSETVGRTQQVVSILFQRLSAVRASAGIIICRAKRVFPRREAPPAKRDANASYVLSRSGALPQWRLHLPRSAVNKT